MTWLRWTTRSARNLAAELRACGHMVSHHSVARLLVGEMGYSLAIAAARRQHPRGDGRAAGEGPQHR